MFSKKNYSIKQKQPKEKKNFSAEIQLDQNILNVSLFKNNKQSEEPISKLLGKISKEKLTEHVTISLDDKELEKTQYQIKSNNMISLDDKELEKTQYQIKSNNMISLVLDNDDSYEITATADDDKELN